MAENQKKSVADKNPPLWSWVNVEASELPQAKGPGRYVRPLSMRDQVIAQAFGQEVRRLRRLEKTSTAGLAKRVGLSQPWIVNIETKQNANIELRLMWDFAEAFGVAPGHFVDVCESAVKLEKSKHLKAKGEK